MIIKEYRVKRERTNQWDKRIVLKCDKCHKLFDIFNSSFAIGQKRHPGKHLCLICSNAREYKHYFTGEKNKRFRGGISSSGHRRIYYDGKNQSEHRVVAEQKIGRKLRKGEEVHHIDFIKLNNSMDNLFVFGSKRDHRMCHCEMEKLAMSLLNKAIWFDALLGTYVTWATPPFNAVNKYGESANSNRLASILPQDHTRRKFNGKTNRYIYKKGENRALHLFIIEEIIGRPLYRKEVIHHINGNELDNSIDNLFLSNRSDHRAMHESLGKCISELYGKNVIGFDKNNGTYFLK